jgi:hypothetical protein
LLAHDRARSDLTETERRYVARIADAAFEAAEQGHVYLVQRPGDFSYLAIKAGGGVCRAAPPIRTTDLAAARLPSHPRRKDQPWRSPSLP